MTWLLALLGPGCSWFGGGEPVVVPAVGDVSEGPRGKRGGKRRGNDEAPTVRAADLGGCDAFPVTDRVMVEIDAGGKTYPVMGALPEGAGPRDLLILLHGGRGDGAAILRQTDMGRMVKRGAVVLAPDGEVVPAADERKWNSGKYGEDEAEFPRDDVAFLDALAGEMRASACIDRVFVVGFSGGAGMANRWLCQGANPPDAMMTAAGTLMVPTTSCVGKPTAVRGYIGSDDSRVEEPARGGKGFLDATQTMAFWAERNGCTDKFDDRRDGDTTCRTWKGCKAPTVFCTIQGFGHAFPVGNKREPACDHDAGEVGWTWFDDAVAHRR